MRHLNYANVMSTIAMFAAVSTGGAYAANTLAKDSVRSIQIKNGQVTLADLHPSVKKRLGVAASRPTSGGGAAVKPGKWTTLKAPGSHPIRSCTNTACGNEYVYPIQFAKHSLPAGKATYDLDVTLTNNGNVPMFVEGLVVGGSSPISAANPGSPIGHGICNPPSRGVEAGATVTYSCRVQGGATTYAGIRYTTRAVYGVDLVTPEANVALSANVSSLRVLG